MTVPTSNRFDSVASAGASTGSSGLVPVVTIRAPSSRDIRGPNGPFKIGQQWVDTVDNSTYVLTSFSPSNGAMLANWAVTGATSTLATLTGDSGGAIAPVNGNIDILGGDTIKVDGTAGTLTINASDAGYPISPYVVGASGKAGYQTIQSAVDAANGAGGGTVYIQPGTYTENLTLYSNIELVGVNAEVDIKRVIIVGVHVPPASGVLSARSINFQTATHVLNSNSAGSATISIVECLFTVTNGFVFNLPNWTGTIKANDCGSDGTNDGFLNNSGGATVFTNNSQLGAGSGQTMIANGSLRFDLTLFACPVTLTGSSFNQLNIAFFLGTLSLGGSAIYSVAVGCEFFGAVTLAGSSTGSIIGSNFSTGASAAITMSSSGNWSVNLGDITSSNNPAIAGAGAGTLTLGIISFGSNASLAGTLTTSWLPTKTGALTSATTLTATLGAITATNGNFVKGTAGNKDVYSSVATNTTAGANSAGTVTLVGGTATVATTSVTASSLIRLYRQSVGSTGAAATGNISRGTITAGTSFVINSVTAADATALAVTDVSVVFWEIVN